MSNWMKDRYKAFGYAIRGVMFFFRNEMQAKVHLSVFILVLILGFYCEITTLEWMLILLVSGLVFVSEIFNSAIELMLDHLHPEQHEKVGKMKDMAAGAVLIAAAIAAIVGLFVFIPYFMSMI